MKQPKTAALAAALALASPALWAMSGDAWYGTNRPATRVEVTRAETTVPVAPGVLGYEERVTSTPVYMEPAPVVVEREVYVGQPREIVVYGPTVSSAPVYDPRFPQTGPWIDHGLFNRKGPNDFGS